MTLSSKDLFVEQLLALSTGDKKYPTKKEKQASFSSLLCFSNLDTNDTHFMEVWMLGYPDPPWLILPISLSLRMNCTFLDPGKGGALLEIPITVNSIASLGPLSLTIGLSRHKVPSEVHPHMSLLCLFSSFVKLVSVIIGNSIDTRRPSAPLTKDCMKILINQQPANKH